MKHWCIYNAVILILALLPVLRTGTVRPLLGVAVGTFLVYIVAHRQAWKPLGWLGGPANRVTLLRLSGLFLLGFGYPYLHGMLVFVLLIVVVSLDGVDGYLARKYNASSKFGADLDMETDALLVCTFSIILYVEGWFGAWILGIGYLRYVFVLAVFMLRVDHVQPPRSKFNQTVAIILMISLGSPFVFPWWMYRPAIIIAVALVVFSFGRSFVYMVEYNRHEA